MVKHQQDEGGLGSRRALRQVLAIAAASLAVGLATETAWSGWQKVRLAILLSSAVAAAAAVGLAILGARADAAEARRRQRL